MNLLQELEPQIRHCWRRRGRPQTGWLKRTGDRFWAVFSTRYTSCSAGSRFRGIQNILWLQASFGKIWQNLSLDLTSCPNIFFNFPLLSRWPGDTPLSEPGRGSTTRTRRRGCTPASAATWTSSPASTSSTPGPAGRPSLTLTSRTTTTRARTTSPGRRTGHWWCRGLKCCVPDVPLILVTSLMMVPGQLASDIVSIVQRWISRNKKIEHSQCDIINTYGKNYICNYISKFTFVEI